MFHTGVDPGRVNQYLALDCAGDGLRCFHTHTALARACDALVNEGDVLGAVVMRLDRLRNGKIDWLRSLYGVCQGIWGDGIIESSTAILGERSPFLVVAITYYTDVADIDGKLERFAAANGLTLVRRHGPFDQIETFLP